MTATFEVRESAPVDRNRERAVRMAQVVEQFATRLTLRPVRCRVADRGVAPAWSTSNTISFNGESIGDLLDPRVVSATRGLALHEVCHILFTPRSGSDIVQWVLDTKVGRAFNSLEDQRIETLMVGRFGASVVDWLTLMVGEHLLNNQEGIAYSFPLIRGRKYLPVEVRRAVRSAYVNQQDIEELSSIIDEYRLLLFPADTERAKELIVRFDQLVKQAGKSEEGDDSNGWDNVPDPHAERQHGEHESTPSSKPLTKREQESARSNAQGRQEQDEADKDESATNTPAPSSKGDTDTEDEDDFNFGDGDTDWDDSEDESQDEPQGSPSESQQDADGASDSDSSSETGDSDGSDSSTGDSAGTGGEPSVSDVLENAVDDLLEKLADQIADDIAKYNGDIELEGDQKAGTPARATSVTASVSDVGIRASKSFGHELERLRADFDPAWERRTSSGRINPQRYMTGVDFDEVFDRWSEGRDDAVDIEAVILLDTSGSMSSHEQNAYESMWALKRSLDRINASCTVITYSSEARLLYDAEEKATSTVKNAGTGGGTNPLKAIRYSTKVLANSSRAVKLLFTITDGEWSDAEECDKLIRKLRDGGVLTALAYIGGSWDGESASNKHHGCEVFSHTRSSADLFSLGRQLVKVATQRNLAH